jgi:hypothetical protein
MSSLVAYLAIAVLGIVLGAFTLWKKRRTYRISTLILFFLFTACITWFGEFVVLGIFNGYAYKPGVFADPWAENLTAHMLLNATIYPATALLLAGFSLGAIGVIGITGFFVLWEYVFVVLGFYEQYWWNYGMSAVNIIIFLAVAQTWFHKMIRVQRGRTRDTVLYFVCFFIIHLPYPILLLLGKEHYEVSLLEHLVDNRYRASTIIIFSYHLAEAVVFIYLICVLGKWYGKLAAYTVAVGGQALLTAMGVLRFAEGWNLYGTLVVSVAGLTIFILLEKYTLKPPDEQGW